MWDNKMMMMLADAGEESLEYTAEGNRIVEIESSGAGSITSATVRGIAMINETNGVGFKEGGRYYLNVRAHGEQFMDGAEMVRLMQEISSPAWGGDEDGEHFIYLASDTESYPVVTSDHLTLPLSTCTLSFVVRLDEDIFNGGRVITGLTYLSTAGARIAFTCESSGVGNFTVSGRTPSGNLFSSLTHRPTARYMELPIRYDSVSLTLGSEGEGKPYVGVNRRYDLGDAPLLASWDGEVCDELECVSGVITRRIGRFQITDVSTLSEMKLHGTTVICMPMPEGVGEGMISLGENIEDSIDSLLEFGYAIALNDDRSLLYFRTCDDDDAETMISEMLGQTLFYPLAEPRIEHCGVGIGYELAEGTNYFEVCTKEYPEILITYTQKE